MRLRSLQTYRTLDYTVQYIVARKPFTMPDGSVVEVGGTVDLAVLGFRRALRMVNARYLQHPDFVRLHDERRKLAGGGVATVPSERAVQRAIAARGEKVDPEGETVLKEALAEVVEEDKEGEKVLLETLKEEAAKDDAKVARKAPARRK